jgi:DNA-binding ferritin-like protein (Dps family)
MTMSISKLTTKVIGEKRRWQDYKARVRKLPPNYRAAVEALERYLMHFGPEDGESAASIFENLADLFEQSAASGTSIRAIVGNDPVEFIEELRRNYPEARWRSREQQRLIDAIDRAANS